MTPEEALREAARRVEAGEGRDAWGDLARWAARLGRRPDLLAGPRGPERVLAALAADPGDRAPARLLERCLPVEIAGGGGADPGAGWVAEGRGVAHPDHAYARASGRPIMLRLRGAGVPLRLAPDERAWEAVAAVDETLLREALGRPPRAAGRVAGRRDLRWLDAAECAQRLTDRYRAAGAIDPAWEVRLPRSPKRRHLFPPEALRLVLAPTRRRVPRPPALAFDRPYLAYSGAGFQQWLRFEPGGRARFLSATRLGADAAYARLADTGRDGGRWELAGRDLRVRLPNPGGRFEFAGYVDDDGRLCLWFKSHITGHESGNRWGPRARGRARDGTPAR